MRFLTGFQIWLFSIAGIFVWLIATYCIANWAWCGLRPELLRNKAFDWQLYSDEDISFRYPAQWSHEPSQIFGSRAEIEFKDGAVTVLVLIKTSSYSQVTGKQQTLDVFLGEKSNLAADVVIDGQKAKKLSVQSEMNHRDVHEEVVIFADELFITLRFEGPVSQDFNNDVSTWFVPLLSSIKVKGGTNRI